jgi:hypothetical protein
MTPEVQDLLLKVLTGALSVIGSVGWFWLQRVTSQLDNLRHEISKKGVQISQLEGYVVTNEKRLDRIELKIDKLLDRSASN